MRPRLMTTALALAIGCGSAGTESAFEGTWAGSKLLVTEAGTSAVAQDIVVSISDDGHGNLELNGLAPARVTSDRTFEALTVTFPTIYGPGYRGPGNGTTSVTGGAGVLATGADGLTITLDFTETEAGVARTYHAIYTLHRSAAPGGSSL